ncbi:hypothetical protein PENSOL_c001G02510 [Penicillium solitum]|uniref:Uncharacterized protein n=1 Tax=Penicillium solitum TaxID=60172 RepID=A0A1V6RP53_9EURO|nr:uncharacterized protein PENSOL_c001G02510 [Penicillium solitum]OQE03575.1 hypothetical protein PENSOL_c001G02510 [Penicillium solitum]
MAEHLGDSNKRLNDDHNELLKLNVTNRPTCAFGTADPDPVIFSSLSSVIAASAPLAFVYISRGGTARQYSTRKYSIFLNTFRISLVDWLQHQQ